MLCVPAATADTPHYLHFLSSHEGHIVFFPRPIRTPRPTRKERPQRRNWNVAASEIRYAGPADGYSDRPFLVEHPDREIAAEVMGFACCPACGVVYAPRLAERIMSPAFLRAQRWAHAHNAERHPRRWLRSQHFQAPVPAEIRERVAS